MQGRRDAGASWTNPIRARSRRRTLPSLHRISVEPECFAQLRRLLEATLKKHGSREYVQVLRMPETFDLAEVQLWAGVLRARLANVNVFGDGVKTPRSAI